jgi:tRNA dimethylallyltransferase
MEILTAKPTCEQRARVAHHLVGEVVLTAHYDVAQWLSAARQRIAEIHARGCRAIVAGGTGLYVRALTRGLAQLPSASPELRAELAALPLIELQRRLAAIDPLGAEKIDVRNPRRVIRALEVCLLTGRPFSSFREQWETAPEQSRGIVLTRERNELYERIDRRTEAMFALGVVEEVRALGEAGPTASQTLGLMEIREYIAGRITREECVALIRRATRRYAKRQLTWFRRETVFRNINLSLFADHDRLVEEIAAEVRGS